MIAKLSKVVVLAMATVCVPACKGKKDETTPKNTAAAVQGIPKVDPTLCETSGKNVVTYDLNRDNQPDVWRLYRTEDEGGTKIEFMTCKQVDTNHDGNKDWVVAYNRKGNPIFERNDFDYDGKFDMSAVFDTKTTFVAEVERDTNFDGRYDVRELYDSRGALSSVRRDRNGDNQPDEWEQYKETILVAILYDDNFDGRVDRREEIPGATPKIEMPTTQDPTASSQIPADPAPAPKKK